MSAVDITTNISKRVNSGTLSEKLRFEKVKAHQRIIKNT
jgi:hypothetical protein